MTVYAASDVEPFSPDYGTGAGRGRRFLRSAVISGGALAGILGVTALGVSGFTDDSFVSEGCIALGLAAASSVWRHFSPPARTYADSDGDANISAAVRKLFPKIAEDIASARASGNFAEHHGTGWLLCREGSDDLEFMTDDEFRTFEKQLAAEGKSLSKLQVTPNTMMLIRTLGGKVHTDTALAPAIVSVSADGTVKQKFLCMGIEVGPILKANSYGADRITGSRDQNAALGQGHFDFLKSMADRRAASDVFAERFADDIWVVAPIGRPAMLMDSQQMDDYRTRCAADGTSILELTQDGTAFTIKRARGPLYEDGTTSATLSKGEYTETKLRFVQAAPGADFRSLGTTGLRAFETSGLPDHSGTAQLTYEPPADGVHSLH